MDSFFLQSLFSPTSNSSSSTLKVLNNKQELDYLQTDPYSKNFEQFNKFKKKEKHVSANIKLLDNISEGITSKYLSSSNFSSHHKPSISKSFTNSTPSSSIGSHISSNSIIRKNKKPQKIQSSSYHFSTSDNDNSKCNSSNSNSLNKQIVKNHLNPSTSLLSTPSSLSLNQTQNENKEVITTKDNKKIVYGDIDHPISFDYDECHEIYHISDDDDIKKEELAQCSHYKRSPIEVIPNSRITIDLTFVFIGDKRLCGYSLLEFDEETINVVYNDYNDQAVIPYKDIIDLNLNTTICPYFLALKIRPDSELIPSFQQYIDPKSKVMSKQFIKCFLKNVNQWFQFQTSITNIQKLSINFLDQSTILLISPSHSIIQTRSKTKTQYPLNDNTTYISYPQNGVDSVIITRGDMSRLEEGQFINDNIIDFYMKYLQNNLGYSQNQEYFFFNTFFFTKLSQENLDMSSLHRWHKNINIFEKRFLFIPINLHLHWTLIIICNLNYLDSPNPSINQIPCILYFDSLQGSNSKLVQTIRHWINEEYLHFFQEKRIFTFYTLPCHYIEVPIQDNSCDCGIYILCFMEQFALFPFKDYSRKVKYQKNWFSQNLIKKKRKEIQDILDSIFEQSQAFNILQELSPSQKVQKKLKLIPSHSFSPNPPF